jgi:CRP/FNR family cyclic AMP-dependent transcriptional regulator
MKRSRKPLADILERCAWMQDLPTALRQRVIDEAFDTEHNEGDVVARQGDPVTSWIGVADGILKISGVYRSGRTVMFTGIPTGSWVGEGSVLKRELRKYDIVAMRPSRVIHVPRATLHWLLDNSFDFNRFMLSYLNERLGQYIGMVETDRLTDPAARLARSIASLFNPILYPQMGPLLAISQAELGELVGLSRQTTNAALKKLEKEGLVVAEYGGVLVKELAALRAYEASPG